MIVGVVWISVTIVRFLPSGSNCGWPFANRGAFEKLLLLSVENMIPVETSQGFACQFTVTVAIAALVFEITS